MKTLLSTLSAAALFAGVVAMASQTATAGSPYGTWERPKTGAHIKVYKCGGGLGMKVVKSKKSSSVGKRLMCGAKKNGSKWEGDLTSTEDGKTYSGYVSMNGSKLKLKGCALGIFCKTEYWSKL